MKYKLIACDLDGTLLNDKSKISNENLESIKAFKEKGIIFMPVTGRTLYEIPESIRNCPYIDYIIYSDGAVTMNKATGEDTSRCLSSDTSKNIFEMLKNFTTMTEVFVGGNPVTEKDKINKDAYLYYNIDESYHEVIDETRVGVDNLDNYFEAPRKVEIFNIFFKYEKERQQCFELLKNFDDILVTTSMSNNIEFSRRGVNKGSALRQFCENFGISPKDVICLGDSKNDVEMFKYAFTALAVSNADPYLKQYATEIICSNNEHAADFVLKNYIEV